MNAETKVGGVMAGLPYTGHMATTLGVDCEVAVFGAFGPSILATTAFIPKTSERKLIYGRADEIPRFLIVMVVYTMVPNERPLYT